MDIRKLLERDHREVEEDFRALERADDDDEGLVEKIILELTLHAEVEERVLYPALDEVTDTDLVERARVEHEEVKDTIADIRASSADRREDLLDQIKIVFLEHVEREESELFPMVAKELGRDRLEELGDRAEQVREEFLEGHAAEAIEGDTEAEVTGEDFRAVAAKLEDERPET